MRLWLTPATGIPLRDQMVRQIALAISSGELPPGTRLPSVRALGRRFGIHSNTVSAAYGQLKDEGLLLTRQGSGMYVAGAVAGAGKLPVILSDAELTAQLTELVALARKLGLADRELLSRLQALLRKPDAVVLVDDDPALIEIAVFEIGSAGRCRPEVLLVEGDWAGAGLAERLEGRRAAVLPSKAAAATAVIGDPARVLTLQINPAAEHFARHLPPSREHLIAIASRWDRFRELARTFLLGGGFSPEALLVRVPGQPGWLAGLAQAEAVICDSLTRTMLPPGTRPLVFPLLAPAALQHFPRSAM